MPIKMRDIHAILADVRTIERQIDELMAEQLSTTSPSDFVAKTYAVSEELVAVSDGWDDADEYVKLSGLIKTFARIVASKYGLDETDNRDETVYQLTFATTERVDLSVVDDYREGTLADALELASLYETTITLRDEPGFIKGWVHSDGSYTLQ